jgi:glyoxylase-like metal-dependent hydrolase (beta-lactamase superfamily II)
MLDIRTDNRRTTIQSKRAITTATSMASTALMTLALTLLASKVQAQDAKRSITKVAGDVYRFQNNFHVNVFTITSAGVVVTDPINADAAGWLKAEIAKLTDQPITHLIYSHSHGDHASGGSAYGDVATVIAQHNAPQAIDGVVPTVRFADAMQFTHGGKTFELTHLGPGHGVDLLAVVIRPENVAFVVDAVSSKRLFFRDFSNANLDDWAQQVKTVQSLSFETFVGGHGAVGVKGDVDDALAYLSELRTAVLQGLQAGQCVEQLSKSVTMDKYKEWAAYGQWRELNVQGMARHLKASAAAN